MSRVVHDVVIRETAVEKQLDLERSSCSDPGSRVRGASGVASKAKAHAQRLGFRVVQLQRCLKYCVRKLGGRAPRRDAEPTGNIEPHEGGQSAACRTRGSPFPAA